MSAVKPSGRIAVFWILGLAINLWAQSDWTVRRTGTASLAAVTWTGTQFVAVGGDSILSSPDGIVWTSRPSPVCCLVALIWTGSQFVAVGGAIPLEPNPQPLPKLTGSQFVAVGGAMAVTSPDGVTWTQRNTGASFPLTSVAWTGSRLVAVGADGRAYVSPDGVIWAFYQVGIGNQLSSVAWTGNQLVAVGTGTIAISDAMGSSWDARPVGSGLSSVTYGNGMRVAVGDSIFSSLDGIAWTRRRSERPMNEVTWTGNEFVAVGGNGQGGGMVMASSNGVDWTVRTPEPSLYLHSVASSNTQLVALGNRSILTSPVEPVMIRHGAVHQEFSIRLTSSHLFVAVPNHLGLDLRAALYASTGRKVAEVGINRAASEVEIPIDDLQRGVYVLVMRSKTASLHHRFSLTR